jgi:hypothetical protein
VVVSTGYIIERDSYIFLKPQVQQSACLYTFRWWFSMYHFELEIISTSEAVSYMYHELKPLPVFDK